MYYTKEDVRFHGEYMQRSHPAVNIKIHGYGFPGTDEVVERFGCTEKQAEKALGFAFDSAVVDFWDQAQEVAHEVFGKEAEAYAEGRSGGWLVVHNLPDVESWDAIRLSTWRGFEKQILSIVKDLTSPAVVLDNIEANQWWKEGSEQYNFSDTKEGTISIPDMKAKAIAAGFGAVVRK